MFTDIMVLVIIILAAVVAGLYLVQTRPWKDKAAENLKEGADTLARQMADMVVDGVSGKLQTVAEYDDLVYRKSQMEGHVADLDREIKNLSQEKLTIKEDFARQRRELEHEVGLQKKQLEHELQTGQEKADLSAEKKILVAEKKFNDQALKDAKEAMDARFESQDKMITRLAALVPNIEASFKRVEKGS